MFFVLLSASLIVSAQEKGNIHYMSETSGNQYHSLPNLNQNAIDIRIGTNADLVISAKGLSNIQADVFVAIFSVTQTAKTTEQVNQLINDRIGAVKKKLTNRVELFVDMITFVPVYEYDVTKKIFSKTYNEVPVGYELKKNLHIKYSDPNLIHELISVCAASEIHDLVRVDHICTKIDQYKNELREKTNNALIGKLGVQQKLLQKDFTTYEKNIADGFEIRYPSEMYGSYQAYSSSSLKIKRGKVKTTEKSTTYYYQPIADKGFDVVINPIVIRPVIQLMYEVKLKIRREEKRKKDKKEYIIISPNGDFKHLPIGN